MILRKSGDATRRLTYPAIDVLRAELDAFADAIDNERPFPVPEADVLATLSAFEAALASMKSGVAVACRDAYEDDGQGTTPQILPLPRPPRLPPEGNPP